LQDEQSATKLRPRDRQVCDAGTRADLDASIVASAERELQDVDAEILVPGEMRRALAGHPRLAGGGYPASPGWLWLNAPLARPASD
jgi:hypothetical protein